MTQSFKNRLIRKVKKDKRHFPVLSNMFGINKNVGLLNKMK